MGQWVIRAGSWREAALLLSASAASSPASATVRLRQERTGTHRLGLGLAEAGLSLGPGQRRIYWLLPVCGAVGLGP